MLVRAVAGGAILDDLVDRGLVQDSTDFAALRSRLDDRPITLYCGFDPTADSLHVGSLVPIMLLRWWQRTGHKPIVLMGGGTTKDLMMLVQGIRHRVEKTRGIKLQTRFPLLGNEPGKRR